MNVKARTVSYPDDGMTITSGRIDDDGGWEVKIVGKKPVSATRFLAVLQSILAIEQDKPAVTNINVLQLHVVLNEQISVLEKLLPIHNGVGLRRRCMNVLEWNRIYTIGQFVQLERRQLLKLKHFGKESLRVMEEALIDFSKTQNLDYELHVGMDTMGWQSVAIPA